MARNQRIDWEEVEKICKITVIDDIKKKINNHILKHENRTTRIPTVETSLNENHQKSILKALDDLYKTDNKLQKIPNLTAEFRLEQGNNKGSGQYEIQRNGVQGKTTVAEVISVDGFMELVNQMNGEKTNKIWIAYRNLVLDRLKISVKSNNNKTFEISYISFDELIKLMKKCI